MFLYAWGHNFALPCVSFLSCRYTFLLDRNRRVRWRGTGFASEDDINNLMAAMERLHREQR